jgi:hypothetical protein
MVNSDSYTSNHGTNTENVYKATKK